jgi:hypothetical protein
MNKKQDEYKVKVDSKYSKYIKLAIAILTAFGLIGTAYSLTQVPSLCHHRVHQVCNVTITTIV